MKVLTLTQPWATLVAIGAKRIETRSWQTTYRGPLLIHAGKGLAGMSRADLEEIISTEPFTSALEAAGITEASQLPRGAIVARCVLVDVERVEKLRVSTQERAFGNYAPGRFGWLLSDIRALPEPIPAKGALGLWDYDGEVGL